MLVGLSFTVAFALGVSGFLVEGYDLSDSVYRAIGLFILQGGESTKSVWQLEVSRFLAPITLSTATIRGLFALASSSSGVIGRRLLTKGHLILVADGEENGQGILDLRALASSSAYLHGRDLVMIAPDAQKLNRALKVAGAHRCSEIVVALNSDERTLGFVHKLRDALSSNDIASSTPIRAEVSSWKVWSELQRVDFAGSSGTTWFNRDQVAAQMVCRSVRELTAAGTALCSTDPEIASLATEGTDIDGGVFNIESEPGPLVDHGLICHRGAGGTLEGATALTARIRPGGRLTAVCSGDLAAVIRRVGASSGVEVVTVDPAEWMAPWLTVTQEEQVAMAVHECYRHMGTSAGWLSNDDPANKGWEQIPEQLRESSRSGARAILSKLESRGLVIRQSNAGADSAFEFTHDEAEELAVLEHERWCAERTASGWTLGARNVEAKHTPNLVPWSDLPELERDKDRELVRAIPSWLRGFGYEVHR